MDYLVKTELVHMGLGVSWDRALARGLRRSLPERLQRERRARRAAAHTVAAIRRYVEELDADWHGTA